MKNLYILVAEDNPADVELMQKCSNEAPIPIKLSVVNDGVSVLSYLRRTDGYETATKPDLIILDLKLPRKNGLAVLKEIKSDESLLAIPVIMLSTSNDEDDIRSSHDLQASAFLTKPSNLDGFQRLCKQIISTWGSKPI